MKCSGHSIHFIFIYKFFSFLINFTQILFFYNDSFFATIFYLSHLIFLVISSPPPTFHFAYKYKGDPELSIFFWLFIILFCYGTMCFLDFSSDHNGTILRDFCFLFEIDFFASRLTDLKLTTYLTYKLLSSLSLKCLSCRCDFGTGFSPSNIIVIVLITIVYCSFFNFKKINKYNKYPCQTNKSNKQTLGIFSISKRCLQLSNVKSFFL